MFSHQKLRKTRPTIAQFYQSVNDQQQPTVLGEQTFDIVTPNNHYNIMRSLNWVPSVSNFRRNAWIIATGRQLGKTNGELTVTEHIKICGAHFTPGENQKIRRTYIMNEHIQSKYMPQRFTRSRRAMEYEFAISVVTQLLVIPMVMMRMMRTTETSEPTTVSETIPTTQAAVQTSISKERMQDMQVNWEQLSTLEQELNADFDSIASAEDFSVTTCKKNPEELSQDVLTG
ncbi:unnamed protein product [Mytilus coruscus]|uniref:Uncharacterized protein n=1 Tax=Mytilus coruscus TaxID=42192 RepID=A0A6J8C6J8_MYTCO|nr:unnamed protein product [Mytilus coruscus]